MKKHTASLLILKFQIKTIIGYYFYVIRRTKTKRMIIQCQAEYEKHQLLYSIDGKVTSSTFLEGNLEDATKIQKAYTLRPTNSTSSREGGLQTYAQMDTKLVRASLFIIEKTVYNNHSLSMFCYFHSWKPFSHLKKLWQVYMGKKSP